MRFELERRQEPSEDGEAAFLLLETDSDPEEFGSDVEAITGAGIVGIVRVELEAEVGIPSQPGRCDCGKVSGHADPCYGESSSERAESPQL